MINCKIDNVFLIDWVIVAEYFEEIVALESICEYYSQKLIASISVNMWFLLSAFIYF